MNLTLYIDESGDFETERGEWIVGGLLCRAKRDTVEDKLRAVLQELVVAGRIPSLAECHLWEIRDRHGFVHANAVRDHVLEAIFSSCGSLNPTLVATVNEAKRRVDQSERTYRTMLLDLMALVESGLAAEDAIESFDIVIASRTKNGQRLTTLDQLKQQTQDTLPGQLELGLASRGLWKSFENRALQLKLQPAATSWGLAVADFTANTVHNRSRPEQALIIRNLIDSQQLSIFESFGSYQERRARVAERDGDRVAAIGRWASLPGKNKRVEHSIQEALNRLWLDLLRLSGTTGPFASLESVLEWLSRQRLSTDALLRAGTRIQQAVASIADSDRSNCCARLLYRIRNFLLRNMNHAGRSIEADEVIKVQFSARDRLQDWPEMLPHLLDFGALTIESAVNRLDFAAASSRASDHLQQVRQYLSLWELFTDPSAGWHPASRWFLRAASAYVRARTLALEPAMVWSDADTSGVLVELESTPMHSDDAVRLKCYRIQRFLRAARLEDALHESEQFLLSDCTNDFGLLWASRAVGDALLAGADVPFSHRALGVLRQRTPQLGTDHPADLLWRERGLLEKLVGDDRQACRESLEKCFENLSAQDLRAPIGCWLRGMATLHHDVLVGKPSAVESYFSGAFSADCISLASHIETGRSGIAILQEIRRISVY